MRLCKEVILYFASPLHSTPMPLMLLSSARFSLLLAAFLLLSTTTHAQQDDSRFYDYGNGLGVDGYDVVAYFTRNKALKGKAKHQSEFGGRTWRFANAKHKQQFDAEPEKYLPVYGGHCAYGASKGYLVRGEPKAWTVHKDKLYLNYSIAVRNTWKRNIDGNITRANRHWTKLQNQ